MSLNILVKGKNIDQYNHNGKIYVEGRKGSNYVIQYRNNTSHRQKVVISVDGLNVLTGNTDWTKGYIVSAYGVLNVPGWRKDSNNVAAFEFSSTLDSYNQHNDSGNEHNIGVIGALVYNEKVKVNPVIIHHYNWNNPQWDYYPAKKYWFDNVSFSSGSINTSYNTRSVSRGVLSATDVKVSTTDIEQQLGTGWGDNQKFNTSTVEFDSENVVSSKYLVYYDSRKNLEKMGIKLVPIKSERNPDPFPGLDFGCPTPK